MANPCKTLWCVPKKLPSKRMCFDVNVGDWLAETGIWISSTRQGKLSKRSGCSLDEDDLCSKNHILSECVPMPMPPLMIHCSKLAVSTSSTQHGNFSHDQRGLTCAMSSECGFRTTYFLKWRIAGSFNLGKQIQIILIYVILAKIPSLFKVYTGEWYLTLKINF